MWKVFKENKVSSILLLTVLLGAISTMVDFPDVRFVHPKGNEGHYMNYFVFFVFQYLIGFVFVLSLLIETRTYIDKIMIVNYVCWDVLGFLIYLYKGWPEPKELIIVCFGFTSLLFIGVSFFRWK